MRKSYFVVSKQHRLVIVSLRTVPRGYEDKYTELTEEQSAFREANPDATPEEVFQCRLHQEPEQQEESLTREEVLAEYKERAMTDMSALSLTTSRGKVSDYQFLNAQASLLVEDGTGIYTHAQANAYIATYNTIGKQCRERYYAFVESLTACETIEQVETKETATIEWYKSL